MSQVVYARVPDSLKEAVDLYAEQRGVTLTSAVVDLLERGLVAASDETSMTDLETKLAIASAEKAQVEANLTGAENELGTLRAFAQRSLQPIGSCPNRTCGQPIRGYDLLALGHCPQCRQPLSGLLAPRKPNSLNEREVGVLLGALGVHSWRWEPPFSDRHASKETLVTTQEQIAQFLDQRITWPRMLRPQPWLWQPCLPYPYTVPVPRPTADELAHELLTDAEFRALQLGTWLNTTNGKVISEAVEMVLPPFYRQDAELLVEALKQYVICPKVRQQKNYCWRRCCAARLTSRSALPGSWRVFLQQVGMLGKSTRRRSPDSPATGCRIDADADLPDTVRQISNASLNRRMSCRLPASPLDAPFSVVFILFIWSSLAFPAGP